MRNRPLKLEVLMNHNQYLTIKPYYGENCTDMVPFKEQKEYFKTLQLSMIFAIV